VVDGVFVAWDGDIDFFLPPVYFFTPHEGILEEVFDILD